MRLLVLKLVADKNTEGGGDNAEHGNLLLQDEYPVRLHGRQSGTAKTVWVLRKIILRKQVHVLCL